MVHAKPRVGTVRKRQKHRKSTDGLVTTNQQKAVPERQRAPAVVVPDTSQGPNKEIVAPDVRRRRLSTMKTMRKAPPKDTWQRRTRHMIKYSQASTGGRVYLYSVLTAIVLDFILMVLETLDGPANGGSDPTYPYLPTEQTYFACEVAFTVLFSADFLVKCLVARIQRKFWTRLVTWMDLLAVLPLYGSLFMQFGLGWTPETRLPIDRYLKLLQLFRIVRVSFMLRNLDGMRVLRSTFIECVAPLQITLFFLVTIVMVFATMLFYAEPCYDDRTCPFTDIFNAGFFVMATVSTTGYGDQVPSTDNIPAIVLSTAAMLFGTMYLAMPLAIIGIKYEHNWRRYINYSRTTRSIVELKVELRSTVTHRVNHHVNRVNLEYFRLTTNLSHLEQLVHEYLSIPPDALLAGHGADIQNARFEVLHQSSKHVLECYRLVALHMKVFRPHGKRLPMEPTNVRRKNSIMTLALNLINWAKQVVIQGDKRISSEAHLPTLAELPLRKRLRSILHTSTNPSWLFFFTVLLSLLVFYAETMPVLQAFGPHSFLCLDALATYCASATLESDPGCFVWTNQTAASPTPLRFDCTDDGDYTCYGTGFNFGSSHVFDCATQFASPDKICHLPQCQPGHVPIFDMTNRWHYVEAYCGVVFTVEFGLRMYAARSRRAFLRSPSTWIDMAALVPFIDAGIIAAITGHMAPVFAIVPTFPTVYLLIPLMKSLRIFKLGRHFKASSVLTHTIALTYKRLLIPLFFLFLGCVASGAFLYEIERGVDCFAHRPCVWRSWDLMTRHEIPQDIAASFPPGKRIQVQDDRLAVLTNLWVSTWLAVQTLTTVGYGDVTPRTPLGRLFDILTLVFGWCYTAMPLTVVGGQFHACFDHYLKKGVTNSDASTGTFSFERTNTAAPAALDVLTPDDTELLKQCGVLMLLLDNMIVNLYKINLLGPAPVALAVAPSDVGIRDEEIRHETVPILHRLSYRQLLGKRASSKVQVATPNGPSLRGVLVATDSDRLKRFLELKHLVESELAHLTATVLQLTRVVEKVVWRFDSGNDLDDLAGE
ncbi:Aste57867_3495 [Aphanomyces stellatus]|uniref:Aste57867_3495 protein n=1 Tax=Aphanomyces stellatus TaxID=120398 RepID=A0A485KAN3_9STRA|nr:hypothetical protein As57867_003484 [Aphanomyces stellatus]VFT80659.1 Aste57867_3495 [Aphanomyces stellatus]